MMAFTSSSSGAAIEKGRFARRRRAKRITKETYFEELSCALRRRELLPRPVEEDGLLPAEWNGRALCRVTERGAARYDPN